MKSEDTTNNPAPESLASAWMKGLCLAAHALRREIFRVWNPARTAFGCCFLLAALLSGANSAVAGIYEITFNDGQGDVGAGQIDVESGNNCNYACSGYLNVTSGGAAGNWSLYTAGGACAYPGYMYSPSGGYIYNNAVYVGGGNPQYPATNPLLDYYGLLFTQSNGNELNLWGNADGSYTLGGNVNGWQNFNVQISFQNTTITPVPEAATWLALAFLLVPISASVIRPRCVAEKYLM
jgi:hypothetical protein